MTMTTKNPRRPAGASSGNSPQLLEASVSLITPSSGTKTKVPGNGLDEESKFLVENAKDGMHFERVEITITPVPSVPESLEDHGGLHMQKSSNWRNLSLKILAIFCLLYIFVCSLGFLSDALRLIAGKAAGEILQQDKLINNPIVGVMCGILVTVAVQSSSTSTSIVVSMVSSGLFTVKTAIPIIMGANIGTSFTNTVVALFHGSNRDDFERAFAGGVLHDMFNLLTVSTLLLVEQTTSYLEVTTTKLINMLDLHSKKGGEIQVLSVITKPFTKLIVQINKDVINGWSVNDPRYDNARLMKVWCNSSINPLHRGLNLDAADNSSSSYELKSNATNAAIHSNSSAIGSVVGEKCKFLFNMFDFPDVTVGILLLIGSLVMLCGCLIFLVKILSSLLKGKLALAVQKAVNANIPYVPCLTGYLAIGIGAVMTIMVQSSSVFTSAMTPLIAMGVVSLDRAYPLTLGSNLGTTTTAMLAALATEGPNLKPSIQLALCHFLFNLTGILLFYPIPYMRFPIRMAAALGHITAKYRWFAVFYLINTFMLLPLMVFTLSLIPMAFYCVAGPVGVISVFALVLSFLQRMCPKILPEILSDWKFLPKWCRSLEPYDRLVDRFLIFIRVYCPCCCRGGNLPGTGNIGIGNITTGAGGLRGNSSQVCFINSSRSPSPQEYDYINAGFTRNGQSFTDSRNTLV